MHFSNAGVAQLVERNLAKVEVESSRLFSRSKSSSHSEELGPVFWWMQFVCQLSFGERDAGVAQLVERNLAKVEVESSRLFSRSIQRFSSGSAFFRFCILFDGRIAKWLCSGLQSRRRRFDSVSCLHL